MLRPFQHESEPGPLFVRGSLTISFRSWVVRFGSRLCENGRDWRPDRVRSDTNQDLADRRGKISRIEPREHLMTF